MIKRNKKEFITLACLYAFFIVLGVLFNVNAPVTYDTLLFDSILNTVTAIVIATAVVILLSKYKKLDKIFDYFENVFKSIRQNRKKLLIAFCVFLGAVLVAFLAELAASSFIFYSYFIWQRFLFAAVFLLSALAIYFFRGKPEKTFLCLSLLIGALFSITTPISYSSWDEESHYPWAVEQSSVYRTYVTEADIDIRSILQDDYYDRDTRISSLNEKNKENEIFFGVFYRSFSKIYSSVGHIPSGIAIFLGRCLGLTWAAVFIIGRLGNLLAYSAVMYFAVKRIKYGKYVVSVIGLIPTVLYMASNYSYDSWTISWLMLGTSYFLRELQEPEEKAKYSSLAIMLIAFVLGMGPKAIYFPLMFILFFLGRDKFHEPRHRRTYNIILAVSIAFVVISFVLPFLTAPDSYSDHRGGDGIDSVSQVTWILTNPLKYTRVLLGFLLSYLSLPKAADYLTFYGHLGGFLSIYMYMIVFITAVVFTDYNRRFKAFNLRLKTVTLASCLFSVVLITTALYVSINPVGAENILWVQQRYLLPLIAPALLIVRSGNIKNEIKENCYSSAVFGLSTFFLLSTFWVICVSQYS